LLTLLIVLRSDKIIVYRTVTGVASYKHTFVSQKFFLFSFQIQEMLLYEQVELNMRNTHYLQ